MIDQRQSFFAGLRRCFGCALQNGVRSSGEVLFSDVVRVMLKKCFLWVWISHGTPGNVFHCCLPTLFNCCGSLVDICCDWETGLSTWTLPRRGSVTKEVSYPQNLWERLVKQRGIALVEEYITEAHWKIQPNFFLPVCLARRGGRGWSWNCCHFCRSPSSFVCRGKICSGSSCWNLLPGLGWAGIAWRSQETNASAGIGYNGKI